MVQMYLRRVEIPMFWAIFVPFEMIGPFLDDFIVVHHVASVFFQIVFQQRKGSLGFSHRLVETDGFHQNLDLLRPELLLMSGARTQGFHSASKC